MKTKLTQCLVETWEPNPEKIQVGRTPVKEGKSLPNSETEDIGGFSLAPSYSAKQLRRIDRIRIKTIESGLVFKLKSGGRLRW